MAVNTDAPAKLQLVDSSTTNIFLPCEDKAFQLKFNLSPKDTAFSLVGYVVTCFAYPDSLDVPKVQGGLATAIRSYPGFAGRLQSGEQNKLHVTCNADAYIPFTVSSSPLALAHFVPASKPLHDDGNSSFMFRPADISALRKGLPTLPSDLCNQDIPLARATLVQLADGATLLALTVSHILADQKSTELFMTAWAAGSRGNKAYKVGVFGRDAWDQLAQASSPSPLPDEYDSPYYQWLPPEFRPPPAALQQFEAMYQSLPEVMLVVSRERLQQLKQQANEQLQQLKQESPDAYGGVEWLSTYDAVVGRLWQVLSSLPSRKGKPFAINNAISLRGRVKLPDGSPAVSQLQVGSYIVVNSTSAKGQQDNEPLAHLAAAVRRETNRTAERAAQELAWWNKHEAAGPNEHMGIILRMSGPPPADLYLQGDVYCSQWTWDPSALAAPARDSSRAACDDAGDNGVLLSRPVHCQGMVGLCARPAAFIQPELLGADDEQQGGGGGLCLQLVMPEQTVQQLMALGPNVF